MPSRSPCHTSPVPGRCGWGSEPKDRPRSSWTSATSTPPSSSSAAPSCSARPAEARLRLRRRHARHGRALRGVPRALPERPPDRPRPRHRRPAHRRGAARPLRRPRDPGAHRLRRNRRGGGRRRRRQGRRHPVRPRRVVAAARRGLPRLRVRAGRPARHADGPDHRHHRRGGARHVRRRRPPPHLRALRRGEARGRYARAIIAARAVAPLERSGQLVDVLQAATPAAVLRERHPPSASSRPCASRSTPSCPFSNARSRPR